MAISVRNCERIMISECIIGFFEINRSFNNSIKQCSINKIKLLFSTGNIFEKNKMPYPQLNMISGIPISKMHSAVMIGAFAAFMLVLLQFSNPFVRRSILLTVIVAIIAIGFLFMCLYLMVTYIQSTRKMKKYPPNEILE